MCCGGVLCCVRETVSAAEALACSSSRETPSFVLLVVNDRLGESKLRIASIKESKSDCVKKKNENQILSKKKMKIRFLYSLIFLIFFLLFLI
jgi:hypothetical protein